MNETTKVNFNNADGSFNRDKWLDFMNTSIQSIPYFNAISGSTSKIVNQQSKKVQWAGACRLFNAPHNSLPVTAINATLRLCVE